MVTLNARKCGGIAICLLASHSMTAPSSMHALTITSRLVGPNTPRVAKNNIDIQGFRQHSTKKTRKIRTAIYGESKDIPTDDFKDINIDDVLLEAENALKIAQTSLVSDDETNANEKADDTSLKESVFQKSSANLVDNAPFEAENTLKVAETPGVNGDEKKKIGDDELENLKVAMRESLLSDGVEGIEDEVSITVTEILSSTIGGILLGVVLGSVAAFKIFEFEPLVLFDTAASASNALEFSVPIVTGASLGGVAGFAGSLQDGATGIVARNVLGVPVKALASAIVGNIQQAAREQVEKTTKGLRAIPSNVANTAKQKAAQKAMETKLSIDMAMDAAIEKLVQFLVVLAVVSSLVAVVFFVTNGQLVADISSQ